MADGTEALGITECTSEIIAALERISALEAINRVGRALGATVIDAQRMLNAAHTLSAVLLEEFEQDGTWALDGALSAAAWTAERTGASRAGLRCRRRQGAALALLPKLADKARAGRLSAEHLRAIGECVQRHPGLAAAHEDLFVEQAETLNAEGFKVAARHWLAAADDHVSPEAQEAGPEPESHLHASRTLDGWLRVDGLLAPGDADLVGAALDAGVERMLRAAADGDPSVEGQPVFALRAQALVDLAVQSMRHEPTDSSVPDRYRVAVVVRAGEPTQPAEAACDAAAFRVTLGAQGEVLDVGRQTRRWSTAIRRAVTIRDRQCVFPGCDRPPAWCDIHHCVPWEAGGDTAVENGALSVCRRHHTFIHRQRWTVTIDGGRPTIRRPDGTLHTIQRWHNPTTPKWVNSWSIAELARTHI